MYNLDGKVALVTGAGGERGIGRAIAVRLAQEGANVVVNDLYAEGRGNWGGMPAVVEEIKALGRDAIGVTGSVDDSDQVDAMVDAALAKFGRIDILVNNAGALAGSDRVPVVELAESDFDRVIAVNLKGTFLVSRAVARHMLSREPGGKIINISSVSGKKGSARFAAYCSSKFGVIGLTQVLAQELAPHRINVNAICPSLVETERVFGMASALKPEGMSTEEYRDVMVERSNAGVPLGRIAQADDAARTAAWLASDQSEYITGESIILSGGSAMF
jgi:NAD(P)-dependent dehydrogenase (short-subunit alcohol dehydrogenase family)